MLTGVERVVVVVPVRNEERLLGRCLRCNQPLLEIDPEEARSRVPPWVARTQQEFRCCPECGRIYWPGTHASRMRERLEGMGL